MPRVRFGCKQPLDPSRSAPEEEAAAAAAAVDAPFVAGGALTPEGEARHARRGVRVGFLAEVAASLPPGTTTGRAVALLVKPRTRRRRCRYVELPEMRGRVGPPRAFVSHTWGAPFADLVAAIRHALGDDEYVWVDIFSVRQWAGNAADLAFECVIREAPSLLLVGRHVPAVAAMTGTPASPSALSITLPPSDQPTQAMKQSGAR